MADRNDNTVKMIGPKGKISYVSRKASQSRHLANLGFRIAHDVIPQATKVTAPVTNPVSTNTKSDAGKA